MAVNRINSSRVRAIILGNKNAPRTLWLGAIALAVLVAAMAILQGGAKNVAAQMASGLDVLETCAVVEDFEFGSPAPGVWDVGVDAMNSSWPALPAYSSAAGSGEEGMHAAMVEVWSTTMTVGMASDETITYMGYIPGSRLGTDGSLDDTTFTLDGTEYTIMGIFHQQAIGGFQQLVFIADEPLPEDLVFQTGDDQFPVSESLALGSEKNIHTWPLDTSPGWEEHQNILVSLMEPSIPEPPPGPICG